jgi:hypothetical protein
VINPDFVKLDLPSDTITLTHNGITIMLTASGDGRLIPQLVLDTNEVGVYRVGMTRNQFASLAGQVDYFAKLTRDQLTDITEKLHHDEDYAA